jgi:hypothetical protein
MKSEIKNKLYKAVWEEVSHVAYDICYITSYKTEIDGKKWYKHVEVKRNRSGLISNKPAKVTYSETINSPDLEVSEVVNKMVALAKSQFSNLNTQY